MDVQRHTLIGALRVAAEQYTTFAADLADNESLRRKFLSQAEEVEDLATAIEGATTIHLHDAIEAEIAPSTVTHDDEAG